MTYYVIEGKKYARCGDETKLEYHEILPHICEGKRGVKEYFKYHRLVPVTSTLAKMKEEVETEPGVFKWMTFEAIPAKMYKEKKK